MCSPLVDGLRSDGFEEVDGAGIDDTVLGGFVGVAAAADDDIDAAAVVGVWNSRRCCWSFLVCRNCVGGAFLAVMTMVRMISPNDGINNGPILVKWRFLVGVIASRLDLLSAKDEEIY